MFFSFWELNIEDIIKSIHEPILIPNIKIELKFDVVFYSTITTIILPNKMANWHELQFLKKKLYIN